MAVLSLAIAAHASSGPAGAQARHLWIEGEDAARTTFNRHGWYTSDGVRADLLSPGVPGGTPGAWLAHYDPNGREAEAAFDFVVDSPAVYRLWFRGSVYRVDQWHRMDDGPIAVSDFTDVREHRNLLVEGRIDIRFLAWVDLGAYDLEAGPHTLTIGLRDAEGGSSEVHGGIDALCLSADDWAPSGAVRPGDEAAPGPDDWYPFVPTDVDDLAESVTDLSRLLERPAGGHGPLTRRADGLAFADGTPVRLWGVDAGIPATPELAARQARFLARHGVNLVRLHPVQADVGLLVRDPDSGERRLDPERLDRLDRWFAALVSEGIYVDFSPVFPHVVTPDDGYPAGLYAELPDSGEGKSTYGYVAVSPALQESEWRWTRALLDHVNRYTRRRYADDPALAVVEIHNEDSIFWHMPLNDLAAGTKAPRHTALVQAGWAAWLRKRYADDAALRAAWGPPGAGSRQGDGLANEAMPIYGAWEMTADGPAMNGAEKRRMGDFIRYLAESQRAYYEARIAAVRDLGFRGLTVTTAWRAGGPAADAANLWTDDAADAVDRHAYVGGGAGEWRIAPGAVDDASYLDRPGDGLLSIGMQQLEDKPFLVSEWNHVPPSRWRAASLPLVAFYGMGLQGWDAALNFTAGAAVRYGGGWPEMRSFAAETPLVLGQYPALALAVHRGDLAEGTVVSARRLPLDDAFRGVDAFTRPVPGLPSLETPLDALAVGRVVARVSDSPGEARLADLAPFRDAATGAVRSTTGELVWHAREEYVAVDSPRTAGLVGFAGGRGPLQVGPFTVRLESPFAVLLLTSLDDRPLGSTSHVLITALARDRQTGARYSDDGRTLEDVGGPPLLLEPVRASIRWNGPAITSVRPLDQHGVPRQIEVTRSGNEITIDGRYAAWLFEVRAEGGAAPTAGTATATGTDGAPGTPGATATAATPTAGTPSAPTPAVTAPTPTGLATPGELRAAAFLPLLLRRHVATDVFPQTALATRAWAAEAALARAHPLAEYLRAAGGPPSAAAARANVAAACEGFPDIPDVFGPGAHRRACDGWSAVGLSWHHLAAHRFEGDPAHLAWAGHYYDVLLDVAEDFVYGAEDRPGAGYRDTLAAVWQNPSRAVDVAVAGEALRRAGRLDPMRQRRAEAVLASTARAWLATWWLAGVHPSHGARMDTRSAPEAAARSPDGRDVAPHASYSLSWDADGSNSPAEETGWQGAGAVVAARVLGDRLPEGAEIAAAGRHYVEYALTYDRPDPLHGATVRTLARETAAGPYGGRRYWLKNHSPDAPAVPYVFGVFHSIGIALAAAGTGEQRPWPELLADDQWTVMLAAADETTRAANGAFLIDLSHGGGVGYALEDFPAWTAPCGGPSGAAPYVRVDRPDARPYFVSEVGMPAGLDLAVGGWALVRLASARGDVEAARRWRSVVERALDELSERPPDPALAACRTAGYVSDRPAYLLARMLSALAMTALGADGLAIEPWPAAGALDSTATGPLAAWTGGGGPR